jgi:hypothetical protein
VAPEKVLLVCGAPVDPARLARVLGSPLGEPVTVHTVAAGDDPLRAVEAALGEFDPCRIVLAGCDPHSDVTGAVEDRFGRPVMAVLNRAA